VAPGNKNKYSQARQLSGDDLKCQGKKRGLVFARIGNTEYELEGRGEREKKW
jgi:hypothetical protein